MAAAPRRGTARPWRWFRKRARRSWRRSLQRISPRRNGASDGVYTDARWRDLEQRDFPDHHHADLRVSDSNFRKRDGRRRRWTERFSRVDSRAGFVAFFSQATNLAESGAHGNIFVRATCVGRAADCVARTMAIDVAPDGGAPRRCRVRDLGDQRQRTLRCVSFQRAQPGGW